MMDMMGEKPKGAMVEIEIEKKPIGDVEESSEPDRGGDEEYSKAKTPEEAIQKILDAGSVDAAMQALEECGFEIKKKEGESESEDEGESEDDGEDMLDLGPSKMDRMKSSAIRKAMKFGGK